MVIIQKPDETHYSCKKYVFFYSFRHTQSPQLNKLYCMLEIVHKIQYCFTCYFYRKALKAAIVLQPLLGTTNILMVATPQSTTGIYFAIWTFLTTFLVSFQGFFAALFYCFLNGEVRTKRKYEKSRQ